MQLSVLKSTAPFFSSFRTNPILFNFFFLSLLAIWIVGFLSPIVTKIESPLTQFVLSRTYSRVCHQDSSKCILLGGESMLVCARCTGLYFGAFLAGILSTLTRIPVLNYKLIIIFFLPLTLDVFFTFFDIYSYSKWIAFTTALSFGCAITFIIMTEVQELISKEIKVRNE